MKRMKVKIKELKPNPFRDMENYPFVPEKLEALRSSIEKTGFWDNILARQSNGEIQIAYGHHRLQILREMYTDNFIVDIPVKDLDDATMIKIMANENMSEWKESVAIVDETVKCVRVFLLSEAENKKHIGADEIQIFLNWPFKKVVRSLTRINAIESNKVDKQAVESLPTESAATDFVTNIKKYQKVKPITPETQQRIANKITTSKNLGAGAILGAVMDEIYTKTEKPQVSKEQIKKFRTFIAEVSNHASDLKQEIILLIKMTDEIKNFPKDETMNRAIFISSIQELQKQITNLLNELKNDNN